MKPIALSLAIAAVISFGNAAPIYSQDYVNTPVTLSKEKVKIDGKIFYSHIVLEKQTLFSISKAYEVSVDEIYACNPSLKMSGLKKNSIILIPVKSENQIKEDNTDKKTNTSFFAFPVEDNSKVKSKEKTSEDTEEKKIERANDNAQEKTSKKEKEKSKKKIHTVRWFEDLDSIAEKYEVSVEDLMKANDLTGRKLSIRQKLVIPSKEELDAINKRDDKTSNKNPKLKDATTTEATIAQKLEDPGKETDDEDSFDLNKLLFRKNRTDVSLILPLKADGISSSRNNMDFYSGFLIAVQELGEEGLNVNLNVYDITDQNTQITKNILSGSDVVIGPVSSGNLANTLELACGSCQIVSPLDPRAEKLAHNNWNMIQAPTPHKIIYKELAEWIKDEKKPADSIIFISEKGARDNATYTMMRSAADSARLSYRTFSYSILEGRNILEPLSRLMTNSGNNRFVVASESEAFVNDVVRNLNLLIHNKYNVTLYAPAKIRNFETMEVENLHNTNLHICLGYDIDYNDPEVRSFIKKFRALYNAEPTQFAFQGYDIAKYCIKACHKYGKKWSEVLYKYDEEMLQSTFRYRRVENGGWVNEGVRKVVYERNWTIRRD